MYLTVVGLNFKDDDHNIVSSAMMKRCDVYDDCIVCLR